MKEENDKKVTDLQKTNTAYVSLKNRKTTEEILDAMQKSNGITYRVCRILDCTWREFYVLCQADSNLGKAWREIRKEIVARAEETMVDLMEQSVDEDTRFKAAKFFLTNLGHSEGYSQSPNVAMEVQSGEGDSSTKIRAIFGINDKDE